MKDFVAYDEAKALNELRFTCDGFAHYNPNGVFMWKIMCSDEENDHTLSIKDIMLHKAEGYIEAPIYSEVFKWFREEKGLFTYPSKTVDKLGSWYYFVIEDKKTTVTEGSFSYDIAELNCLRTLIEIVKKTTKS